MPNCSTIRFLEWLARALVLAGAGAGAWFCSSFVSFFFHTQLFIYNPTLPVLAASCPPFLLVVSSLFVVSGVCVFVYVPVRRLLLLVCVVDCERESGATFSMRSP